MMEVILFTSKRRMQYSNIKKWHPQFQHLYKLRILTRKVCVLHERDSQAFSPHLKRSRGTEHGGYSFLLKSFANCRPRKRVCYKLELFVAPKGVYSSRENRHHPQLLQIWLSHTLKTKNRKPKAPSNHFLSTLWCKSRSGDLVY